MRTSQILVTASLWLLGGVHGAPAEDKPDTRSQNTYDYVVVGSGPGGGPLACNLARAGYSTLLVEAGDDESDDLGTVIANSFSASPANATWGFFVKHYSDEKRTLKNNHLTWQLHNGTYWVGNGANAPRDAKLLGVYYPRGATVGGSAIVNAMATWLPDDSDWDRIASITGDETWR
jgi:choline dehydrogenase